MTGIMGYIISLHIVEREKILGIFIVYIIVNIILQI